MARDSLEAINRLAVTVNSSTTLVLPQMPSSAEWFRSNYPSLTAYGEWHDKQMEQWRVQVQNNLGSTLNSLRLGAVTNASTRTAT